MDSDQVPTITEPEEAAWAKKQRERVVQYLIAEKLDHAGVSEEPRWFLSPYVAIWAVRSKDRPDAVGWWAISGDLPTDYLPVGRENDDADVLLAFSNSWKLAAAEMAQGRQLPNHIIGPRGREKELAPLLLSRADILADFAADVRDGKL